MDRRAHAIAPQPEYIEGIPKPGEEIAGKYRVERLLGAGGMGAVVAATHLALGQLVAVKFLLAEAALHPNSISRFEREARAAAKIQSDHVAKVHDVGTLPNGTPYMVMEFLEGEDISNALGRGRMSVPMAVRCVLEASEALAEAHKLGIVHRDLKPANLFLARRADGSSRVKVLDFGISKETGLPGAQLTRTSALMGSPVYMAPEQMESAKYADARSDIWALGTILYEALTGVLPFAGDTLPEICAKILQSEPPPLDTMLPGAPPGLSAVVSKALQKKPDTRYQNLAELAAALVPYGDEDAPRSVAVVQRVLGVPVSPSSRGVEPGAPAQLGSFSGQVPPSAVMPAALQAQSLAQPHGGYAPTAASLGPTTSPGATGIAGGYPSAAAAPMGAATGPGFASSAGMATGPGYGAQPGMAGPGYGAQPGMAGPGYGAQPGMATGPGYGAQPGMATGPGYGATPGNTTGPEYGLGGATVQAGLAGAPVGTSTAAPFSQTMGERRGGAKTGVVVAVVLVGLLVGGVGTVALVLTGGSESSESSAASSTQSSAEPNTAGPDSVATTSEPPTDATEDGGAATTASASATASTTPTSTRTAGRPATTAPATKPTATATAKPKPTGKPRPGAELFDK